MRTARAWGWAAVVLAVLSVAFEVTVRLDDWAQFGVPFTAPAVRVEDLSVRDSLGIHARAGTQFRQFRINSLGFRGTDVSTASLSRSLVIVTSGASETFGLYEKAGGEWPQQLRDSLAVRCARPIVVLNAAFAGMSLPTVRQDLARRILPMRPDVVAYYPTPMQYLEAKLPRPAAPSLDPVVPLPAWRSRSYPRLRDAIKRSVPEPVLDLIRVVDTRRSRAAAAITPKDSVPVDRLDAFEAELRGLVGDITRAGVRPVLVIHRNRFAETTSVESQRLLRAWERFYPRYTGMAIVAFDLRAAERIKRVGADSGVLVIDPIGPLRSAKGPVFADFSHFNDAGAALVGREVAGALAPLVCSPMRASPPD